MMGLWRSMAGLLLPSRMVDEREGEGEGEEEEECSMLRQMAVAACEVQNISIPFIFTN